jgi:hypothetical protein
MNRPVTCKCGWSGTIKQLQEVSGNDGVLDVGPGFPVCPSCRSDKDLEA